MRAKRADHSENTVFVNIPYDRGFRRLYLAYITGLIHLGLVPLATADFTVGPDRLDKIFELIRGCRYSIHDLSRVQLDRTPPCSPRFNMPFELGMAVAISKAGERPHDWFAFETVRGRMTKSLSDLCGTEPLIHGGTPEGVMRGLRKAFVLKPPRKNPSPADMMQTYKIVEKLLPELQRRARARTIYEPGIFKLIYAAAVKAAGRD